MSALLGGLAIFGKQGPLVLVALGGTLAVEVVWHIPHFRTSAPMLQWPWYLAIYGLFLLFPFVFRKSCAAGQRHGSPARFRESVISCWCMIW